VVVDAAGVVAGLGVSVLTSVRTGVLFRAETTSEIGKSLSVEEFNEAAAASLGVLGRG
jgi:hypothetical protein